MTTFVSKCEDDSKDCSEDKVAFDLKSSCDNATTNNPAATGKRIHAEFIRLIGQSHTPARSAALLVLGVQKEKLRRAQQGISIDGSWQSTVAWIAESVKETKDGHAIAKACFHSMGCAAALDEHVLACARESRRISTEIKLLGRHVREQVLISLLPESEDNNDIQQSFGDALKVYINTVPPASSDAELVLSLSLRRPQPYVLKFVDLVFLNRWLRDYAPWPGKAGVARFLAQASSKVRNLANISEIKICHKSSDADISSTVAQFLSDLWQLPYIGAINKDVFAHEVLYLAAKSTVSSGNPLPINR